MDNLSQMMPQSPPQLFTKESRGAGSVGPGTSGFALGVLHISSPMWYPPGHIQNATTLPFPVAFECVPEVDSTDVFTASPRLATGLTTAALRLEQRGVRAIVGACGSFAAFQSQLSRCVHVPVFASILTQVNFILSALPAEQKLAIVFANQESFTERIRTECQIRSLDRILVLDCLSLPAFQSLLNEPFAAQNDLESQVIEHLAQFASAHRELGAILLQCSELSACSAALQNRVPVPIFDVVTLANWVFGCVIRRRCAGYL